MNFEKGGWYYPLPLSFSCKFEKWTDCDEHYCDKHRLSKLFRDDALNDK